MHKFLFYNKFIICLYMFRALLCSSSGGQNCIIQHLVSSHCVGGRPVHRLREDCPPDCIITILLYSSTCFEHYVLIIKKSKFYYAASCIITLCTCPAGAHDGHIHSGVGLNGRKISSPPGFDPGPSSPYLSRYTD